jgi:hypothetical protein
VNQLLRIQPAGLTEQLINVAELPDGEIGEHKSYFAGVQLQPVILLNEKRNLQGGEGIAQIADFLPGDRVIEGLVQIDHAPMSGAYHDTSEEERQ